MFTISKSVDGELINFRTTLRDWDPAYPKIIDVFTQYYSRSSFAWNWIDAIAQARNLVALEKSSRENLAQFRMRADVKRMARVAKHQQKQRAKAARQRACK